MRSSFVCIETDVDRYVAALRPASVEIVLRRGTAFQAKVTRVDLVDMFMQRGEESSPRIWRAPPIAERTIVSFLTDPSQASIRSGVLVPADKIAILSHREPYTQVMLGPPRWGALSLPVARMAEIGATLMGRDLGLVRKQTIVAPRPEAMRRLQALHAATVALAETAPHFIAYTAVAHAIEQSLIRAVADCLVGPVSAAPIQPTQRRRYAIVEKFRAIMDTNRDQPLHMPEVCLAIGVAERTLRLCCQEVLGMGPKQYLMARRLRQARRALHEARPDETTVTSIAMSLGFWQLGRFAGVYRQAFGETPQQTLRRH